MMSYVTKIFLQAIDVLEDLTGVVQSQGCLLISTYPYPASHTVMQNDVSQALPE